MGGKKNHVGLIAGTVGFALGAFLLWVIGGIVLYLTGINIVIPL